VTDEDDADETTSRAERLTDRRSRSRERTRSASTESEATAERDNERSEQSGQTGQTEQASETGQSNQTGQPGQSEQASSSGGDEDAEWSQAGDKNVKHENSALYMYLDQRLHDAVSDVFEDVKYHYRKAYDVELQKNRHVYPLILEHGIEPVREMADSPTELRGALDANPYTPVVPSDEAADESESEYAT
jgi:hypothetical protein